MSDSVSLAAPALLKRHVAAATIGNALEFYDFLTYSFFAIQIGHAFFPTAGGYGSLMLSLATFGAGFVTRPLGALVIGAYADRVGRKPAMLLSFLMIGVSIVAMALIPSYAPSDSRHRCWRFWRAWCRAFRWAARSVPTPRF